MHGLKFDVYVVMTQCICDDLLVEQPRDSKSSGLFCWSASETGGKHGR